MKHLLFALVSAGIFLPTPSLIAQDTNRPVPRPTLAKRLAEGPEIIALCSYGLNTYTDKEWGFGDDNPQCFNPSEPNADQIVQAAKAGGIGGIILVCKHHDGFCLWPTKTTEYNITKSPFKNGKGDYVKEMSDACKRAGIKFGVYVSPWDRNNAHYGTEKYPEIFHAQIKELLSGKYGDIFEMWFDGANGGNGYYGGAKCHRKIGDADKYYQFDTVFNFVRALQPNCCIFAGENDNSDFRWPGNEGGYLVPDSRASIDTVGGFANGRCGNPEYNNQINAGKIGGTFFRVCEADFPLRRGWFWHKDDPKNTKNAAYLTKIYCWSVGNGGTMNIGLSPDKSGRIEEIDVRALAGFSTLRKALFEKEVKGAGKFNVVVMEENLTNGEQVDGWKIIADSKEILSGKSIGRKRIRLLAEPVDAQKCELQITAHGPKLLPVSFKRYYADPELVKLILNSSSNTGETDTAKWMTGVEKETVDGKMRN